jgi:hypothetical protein
MKKSAMELADITTISKGNRAYTRLRDSAHPPHKRRQNYPFRPMSAKEQKLQLSADWSAALLGLVHFIPPELPGFEITSPHYRQTSFPDPGRFQPRGWSPKHPG